MDDKQWKFFIEKELSVYKNQSYGVIMKLLFVICLAAMVAIFLFPPWETYVNFRGVNKKEHIGYHFVLSNPEPRLDGIEKENDRKALIQFATVSIEWRRLIVQVAPFFLLFGIAIVGLKSKDSNRKLEN